MIVWGQALMPTAPAGPREDLLGGLLHREDQPPQEPPQFGDAERDQRPWWAVNAARVLRSWAGVRLFFNTAMAISPARITTNQS